MNQNKILFSSITRPFGPQYGDGFTVQSFLAKQNLWAQDIFLTEAHGTHWGLDLIAENIQSPTKVLHYPSLKEFIREVRKGYTHIGISFVPQTLHKLKPMAEAVRNYSPGTKIILGGFGTMINPDDFNIPYDYICRGEGISFMRSILNEKEKKFSHPMITIQTKLFSMPFLGKTAMIFAGLGCPNGCEFCVSSHYFNRKHLTYLENGKEIVAVIKKYKKYHPDINHYVIYDDDFLLFKKRGKEFAEEVKKLDFVPQFTVFSSVKAVSQYSFQELAEMGMNTIWMGFEGMEAGYGKMQGKSFSDIVEGCRQYGISVITSMIIGFDYQNLETINRELEALLQLNPMCSQFLIYGPGYITPLRKKLEEEGRLVGHYHTDFSRQDGFELLFEHPIISKEKMEEQLLQCFKKEYEVLGPSVFRVLENAYHGYKNFKTTKNPQLKFRNEEFRQMLKQSLMLSAIGSVFAPNRKIRKKIKMLMKNIRQEVGNPPLYYKIIGIVALLPALWTKFRYRFSIALQPPLSKNNYRLEDQNTLSSVTDNP